VAGWSDIATPLHFFPVPCFESKFYDFDKEIDSSMTLIRNDRKIIRKIGQKEDLLLIGLFDLLDAK